LAKTWEDVLDRLEADVTALQSQLGGIPTAGDPAAPEVRPALWSPPRDLGPLPEHLAHRARALETAQARLAVRLSDIRATAAHHLMALRAVPSAPKSAPVYLDVEG
jgi:hypothetical protein